MVAPVAEKFTEETVLWVKQHSPKLMTFAITRPESFRFTAGQFARLGFHEGSDFVWRGYSMLSAPYEDTLTFFIVLIEDGAMSKHLKLLTEGSTILLDKFVTGFLLPGRFVDGNELVMLSTGSGIAPFISQLSEPTLWQRFDKIVLVHSVSHQQDLIFNQTVADFADHPLIAEYFAKLTFIPVVTRENSGSILHQRIPQLIEDHQIEQQCGFEFSQERTRFMLCGNPQMVEETFKALLARGFAMHRNRIPGHIIMENGF